LSEILKDYKNDLSGRLQLVPILEGMNDTTRTAPLTKPGMKFRQITTNSRQTYPETGQKFAGSPQDLDWIRRQSVNF
jgi:hypothetical protein